MAKVRFEFEAKGAKKIFLAGDFTNWEAAPKRMRRSQAGKDVFCTHIELPPGTYEYKYIVDGEWRTDPVAPERPNAHGTTNSVLEVPVEGGS